VIYAVTSIMQTSQCFIYVLSVTLLSTTFSRNHKNKYWILAN